MKFFVIMMEQTVGGKKWSVWERVTQGFAIDEGRIETIWMNGTPLPDYLPKPPIQWTEEFAYQLLEMDYKMLKACGAVMPDRTWEIREDTGSRL
jgi:hypothetical protein